MKSKFIAIIALIIVIAVAWLVVVTSQSTKINRINELKVEISQNLEVKTYKNTLSLYEELIKLDDKNVQWYVDYATAYLNLEQYGNYRKVCSSIISKFPENATGYEMLMKYYSEGNEYAKVISTYKEAPDAVKASEMIAEMYKAVEWKYQYLAKSFENIDTLSGGYHLVSLRGQYGYYDKTGVEAIEVKFDIARPFIEEYAAVKSGDNWYFIDKDGDRVIATNEIVEDLYSFSEGYAVSKMGGKYGFVDKRFTKHSFEFDNATNFYNGVAAVKKGDKWALINAEFKPLTEYQYDNIIIDSAGICSRKGVVFAQKSGKYVMLDRNGNSISNEEFDDACLFYDNRAAIKKGDKWGFVDTSGKIVIECKYDNAKSFNAGIAPVEIDEKWGFIDEGEVQIVPTAFEGAEVASENGVLIINTGKVFRFIQFYKFK